MFCGLINLPVNRMIQNNLIFFLTLIEIVTTRRKTLLSYYFADILAKIYGTVLLYIYF
jgi:hypothetical protein